MQTRLFATLLFFSAAIAAPPDVHWSEVTPGHHFEFPRDCFAHPDYRTEWWYYTGNVTDPQGARFGFELVFFRQGQNRNTSNPSAWRIDDLYLAHAAITDVTGKRFLYDERLNRKGPGIAGIDQQTGRIWNGNWSVEFHGESQQLAVTAPDFRFRLTLTPLKPLIINGVNGISQKAEGPGKASYYISFPLMSAEGTIDQHTVKGTAWMDHEWFTHQLEATEVGWDWFSAQLDNNTELMLFELRRKDGTIDPYSSGTLIDAAGRAHHLAAKDFGLTPLEKWTRYPIHWRIEVPSVKLHLDCRAVLPDQELKAGQAGTTYWEGAVNYSGTENGVGYLEMTGYEKPVEF